MPPVAGNRQRPDNPNLPPAVAAPLPAAPLEAPMSDQLTAALERIAREQNHSLEFLRTLVPSASATSAE